MGKRDRCKLGQEEDCHASSLPHAWGFRIAACMVGVALAAGPAEARTQHQTHHRDGGFGHGLGKMARHFSHHRQGNRDHRAGRLGMNVGHRHHAIHREGRQQGEFQHRQSGTGRRTRLETPSKHARRRSTWRVGSAETATDRLERHRPKRPRTICRQSGRKQRHDGPKRIVEPKPGRIGPRRRQFGELRQPGAFRSLGTEFRSGWWGTEFRSGWWQRRGRLPRPDAEFRPAPANNGVGQNSGNPVANSGNSGSGWQGTVTSGGSGIPQHHQSRPGQTSQHGQNVHHGNAGQAVHHHGQVGNNVHHNHNVYPVRRPAHYGTPAHQASHAPQGSSHGGHRR